MMKQYLKSIIQRQVARTAWFKSQINTAKASSFEPYEKKFDVHGIDARFFYATHQAQEWYDPIKPHTKLEYKWVIENVKLEQQNILDGGAHHGHYSVVFAAGSNRTCNLVSVDPFPMNCILMEINLVLNNFAAHIERCAIADINGNVHFTNESNGKIIKEGGIVVESRTLDNLMPDADIIKLDVEGAEYQIIPQAIDMLKNVHTWIIEIHPPGKPHPDKLITLFLERGYDILYVNRERNTVEPYTLGTNWKVQSTIFARTKVA